ncbi:hypothetical protein [Amycolatopsis solani]|uniref:hypothetical protein n=1 Tax=Amycolatopsis solani TaxID=3028615 RepID=UPI0025AF0EE0|nr:hypothetical protein [Amycolatopsis sp. MEP2-6]
MTAEDDCVVRPLTPGDAEEVLALVTFDGLGAGRLAEELAAANDYHWMGLIDPAGRIRAVHRSMRWGDHLLLKGVFVEKSLRGSGAVLRLAFALREAARAAGCAGIAAWVEPHEPEAALARVLRLRLSSTLLHRFEVRIAEDDEGRGIGFAENSGVLTVGAAAGPPLVPDLLGSQAKRAPHGGSAARWVIDGRRIVLSACPARTIADLGEVVSAVRAPAGTGPVTTMELPLPAGDLAIALALTGTGAKRLSRTPVRLGRWDFPVKPATRPVATTAGAGRSG